MAEEGRGYQTVMHGQRHSGGRDVLRKSFKVTHVQIQQILELNVIWGFYFLNLGISALDAHFSHF